MVLLSNDEKHYTIFDVFCQRIPTDNRKEKADEDFDRFIGAYEFDFLCQRV